MLLVSGKMPSGRSQIIFFLKKVGPNRFRHGPQPFWLAQVRQAFAHREAVALSIEHVTPDAIVERYRDLQWQHAQAS